MQKETERKYERGFIPCGDALEKMSMEFEPDEAGKTASEREKIPNEDETK